MSWTSSIRYLISKNYRCQFFASTLWGILWAAKCWRKQKKESNSATEQLNHVFRVSCRTTGRYCPSSMSWASCHTIKPWIPATGRIWAASAQSTSGKFRGVWKWWLSETNVTGLSGSQKKKVSDCCNLFLGLQVGFINSKVTCTKTPEEWAEQQIGAVPSSYLNSNMLGEEGKQSSIGCGSACRGIKTESGAKRSSCVCDRTPRQSWMSIDGHWPSGAVWGTNPWCCFYSQTPLPFSASACNSMAYGHLRL